jgi:hypothetical protein
VYIHTLIEFLDIIHRPVFLFKQRFGDWPLCPSCILFSWASSIELVHVSIHVVDGLFYSKGLRTRESVNRSQMDIKCKTLSPDLYYCQTVACLLMWDALSDERTGLSFARVTAVISLLSVCTIYIFIYNIYSYRASVSPGSVQQLMPYH